jgi:hypothetical protein
VACKKGETYNKSVKRSGVLPFLNSLSDLNLEYILFKNQYFMTGAWNSDYIV